MNFDDVLLVEDESTYHANAGEDCLSSHLLSTFHHCPLIYQLTVTGEFSRPDSNAYILGRATHVLVLEGEIKYGSQYTHESPINPKTGNPYGNETKKFTEWAADMRACDIEPISGSDHELAYRMYSSIMAHSGATKLLSAAPFRERVVRVKMLGLDCQSRIDAFGSEVGIVDLKTCQSLDKLQYQCRDFRYIHQLSFYRSVMRLSGIDCPAVYIIGVEKQFPWRTGVWKIEESSLDLAEEDNQIDIEKLKECKNENNWPTGYEDTRVVSL